jgi:hypothetical protein
MAALLDGGLGEPLDLDVDPVHNANITPGTPPRQGGLDDRYVQ